MMESKARAGALDFGVCFAFLGLAIFWAVVAVAIWKLT
jgi:hypothetical protein